MQKAVNQFVSQIVKSQENHLWFTKKSRM